MIHGSFNPLSFLLRTACSDPDTLRKWFPLDYSRPTPPLPSEEVLFGIANFGKKEEGRKKWKKCAWHTSMT